MSSVVYVVLRRGIKSCARISKVQLRAVHDFNGSLLRRRYHRMPLTRAESGPAAGIQESYILAPVATSPTLRVERGVPAGFGRIFFCEGIQIIGTEEAAFAATATAAAVGGSSTVENQEAKGGCRSRSSPFQQESCSCSTCTAPCRARAVPLGLPLLPLPPPPPKLVVR